MRRISFLTIVILVWPIEPLTTIPLFAQASDSVQPLEELLENARIAEDRYDYNKALELYQKALTLKPNDPFIKYSIAKQLIGMERLDEACETLKEVIAIDPSYIDAYTMLGIFYQKFQDDFDSAQHYYEKAIEADPSAIRPRSLLGEVYTTLQQYGKAVSVYEDLLKIDPKSVSGNIGYGNVLIKLDRFDDALKPLNQAATLDPYDPEPYRLMGQALSKLKKRDEAMAALKKYQTLKDNANALTERLRIVRRTPDNAANWFALGREYLKQKQFSKAIEVIEKGIELDTTANRYMSLLGALYLQDKQVIRAQHYLERAIRLDPENADDYNNLGVCFMFQNEYAKAAEAFRSAIKYGSHDPRIKKNLQTALQKINEQK